MISGGEQAATADSLAIAARALLAAAICGTGEPVMADIRRAEGLARRAIALDPTHIEGRLQLAIALSLQARSMTIGEARQSGFGPEARALAESVLADDPGNAYAHGFLAVWHIEVRRRAGPLGAPVMGASLSAAHEHYEAARTLAGGDPGIHWQYARALTALDARRFRASIVTALRRAEACDPASAMEAVMQSRAETLDRLIAEDAPNLAAWAAVTL